MANPYKCEIDPLSLSLLALQLQGLHELCFAMSQRSEMDYSATTRTPALFSFLAAATEGLADELIALDPEKIQPDTVHEIPDESGKS